MQNNSRKKSLGGSIGCLVAWGLVSTANVAWGLVSAQGSMISGELYYQTVGTPLPSTSAENIWVKAYHEDPDNPGACNGTQEDRWYTAEPYSYSCDWCDPAGEVTEYFFWGLPTGTYYLRTAEGWWDGEEDCNNALPLMVDTEVGTYLEDISFTFYPRVLIFGTIYDELGGSMPVTTAAKIEVVPYKIPGNDPCEFEPGWPLLHTISSSDDYTYSLPGVPAGNYVLLARDYNYAEGNEGYFLNEFYNSSGGTTDCDEAEIISITDPTDWQWEKDFYLHEGGIISGTIYQESGEPVPVTTDMIVTIYSAIDDQVVDVTGPTWSYSFLLEEGNYYLSVTKPTETLPYAWWAVPNTASKRSGAQAVTVTPGQTEPEKDFFLDRLQGNPVLAPIYLLLMGN